MKLSHAVFLAAASVFFALTVLPPYLGAAGYAWAPSYGREVFEPFCHQLPERSFFVRGLQMPVCARCFGIYAGMLIGALLYPLASDGRIPKWWLIFAAAAPLTADGVTQLLGLRESTNLLRLATGLLFGFFIPFYLLPVFDDLLGGKEIFKRRC